MVNTSNTSQDPAHEPLSLKCQRIMRETRELTFEGLNGDILKGAYIERAWDLAIIDRYIEMCKDAPRVEKMLRQLRSEVEREAT